MRGFLHLLRRDLTQRWPLFVASLLMGLFVLGFSYLPGARVSPAEIRGAEGVALCLLWSTTLALLLGGSIFTRDLTQGRLAFDFRLPVRPSAIWAARLFGAIATITLATALALAPPAAAGMDFAGAAAAFDFLLGSNLGISVESALAFLPLALLALLLLANPAALATRFRQGWAGVDLLSLGIVCVAASVSWQLLRLWEARTAIWWTGAMLATFTVLGAAIASFRQVTRGRTEADRAQKALSLTLFAAAFATACAVLAYANWCVRPPISALVGNHVYAEGLGPNWVSLLGPTTRGPDFWARFLLHPASARAIRLGPGDQFVNSGEVQGSRDGSRAAWTEWDSSRTSPTLRLYIFELGSQQSSPTATAITWKPPLRSWALSPGGDAVASLQYSGGEGAPRRLVVESVDSAAIEVSVLLPGCERSGPLFFLNRRELLAACGAIRDDLGSGRWGDVFHVDLTSRVVRPFAPGINLNLAFAWRFRHSGPRPWDSAERSGSFEGPIAIDSISKDKNGRLLWFDPQAKVQKPLLEEEQYEAGLRNLY